MTNLAKSVFLPWENFWYFRFFQNSSSHCYFFSCIPKYLEEANAAAVCKALRWVNV